jgi:hypothetical protein
MLGSDVDRLVQTSASEKVVTADALGAGAGEASRDLRLAISKPYSPS